MRRCTNSYGRPATIGIVYISRREVTIFCWPTSSLLKMPTFINNRIIDNLKLNFYMQNEVTYILFEINEGKSFLPEVDYFYKWLLILFIIISYIYFNNCQKL